MHPLVSELPQNVLPEVTAFGIRCEKLLILPLRNIEIAINLTALKSQIQLLLAFVIYGPAKDARFYPYPLHRLLSLPFSPSYARLPKAHEAAVHQVEKFAPVYGVTTLEDQLGAFLTERRFQTMIITGFSAIALLLAAVGIFGLIHYSVATRRQEIGVRMALGAQASEIFRMFIGEALKLSLTGLGFGLVAAFVFAEAYRGLLFGVTSTDPLTFVEGSFLLLVHRTVSPL